MQVFSSLTSAQHATDRMHVFFEDMREKSVKPFSHRSA